MCQMSGADRITNLLPLILAKGFGDCTPVLAGGDLAIHIVEGEGNTVLLSSCTEELPGAVQLA